MRTRGVLAGAIALALCAGCWCPCEVHGTTLPLPQQQCAQTPAAAHPTETGPASQPTGGGAHKPEAGPASQPTH